MLMAMGMFFGVALNDTSDYVDGDVDTSESDPVEPDLN